MPAISVVSYPISMCAVYTTSRTIRSNEAHKSHTEMVFLFLLRLFLCFSFSLFSLVQSNLDYLDSLGLDELVWIIEDLDNQKYEY